MRHKATKYRIVQDAQYPYAGKWIIEDADTGAVIAGPFDTRREAVAEVEDRKARGEELVEAE